MNPKRSKAGNAAFGLVELLAIVAVVIILGVVFLPVVAGCGGHHGKAPRIKCVNNLKNVGLAFRIFATDNNDLFPPGLMVSNGVDLTSIDIVSVYKSLSNELSTPKLLHCSADKQRKPAENFTDFTSEDISYFVSLSADETQPQIFLAGDRNLQINGTPVKPGLLVLTTNAALGWTKEIHNEQGNVAMADGSVQQMSSSRLKAAVPDQRIGTNYIVVP